MEIKHRYTGYVLWTEEGESLVDADLTGADLTNADLRGAVLRGADLSNAHLGGADLNGAILPTRETWEEYLSIVVPDLLTSGGKTVAQIVEAGAWDCHNWANCPLAVAYGVRSLSEVPLLLRPRAEQFVQFFDARLIPCPVAHATQEGAE